MGSLCIVGSCWLNRRIHFLLQIIHIILQHAPAIPAPPIIISSHPNPNNLLLRQMLKIGQCPTKQILDITYINVNKTHKMYIIGY